MRKLFARVGVVAVLAAFAVPALPCDAMKNTTASAPQEQEKAPKKDVKAKKVEKKATSTTVASVEKK